MRPPSAKRANIARTVVRLTSSAADHERLRTQIGAERKGAEPYEATIVGALEQGVRLHAASGNCLF